VIGMLCTRFGKERSFASYGFDARYSQIEGAKAPQYPRAQRIHPYPAKFLKALTKPFVASTRDLLPPPFTLCRPPHLVRLLDRKIVWELVSDIEEQQELAARARETVLAKLQETLGAKMKKHKENAVAAAAAAVSAFVWCQKKSPGKLQEQVAKHAAPTSTVSQSVCLL